MLLSIGSLQIGALDGFHFNLVGLYLAQGN